MARFKKKPVIIEAALYDGERVGDVVDAEAGLVLVNSWPSWFPPIIREVHDIDRAKRELCEGEVVTHGASLFIGTLEGTHEAKPGDWIIRGVKGEIYPCKPDIFAQTYEAV